MNQETVTYRIRKRRPTKKLSYDYLATFDTEEEARLAIADATKYPMDTTLNIVKIVETVVV